MSIRASKPATGCLICGYDLAGLPAEGSCPECGAPAVQADGALLRHAGQGFLRELERGSRLALLASWLRLILQVLAAATAMLPDPLDKFSVATVLTAILSIGVAAIGAVGWWRLTVPPPWAAGDAMEARRRFLRQMVLAFLAVSIVIAIAGQIGSAVSTVDPTSTSLGAVGDAIMSALGMAAALVSILTYVAGVRFLAPFCERLGDDRLYRSARRLRWTIPLALVAVGSLAALAGFAGLYLPRIAPFVIELSVFPALYWLVWVRFLSHLHRRIREVSALTGSISPTVPNASPTEPRTP